MEPRGKQRGDRLEQTPVLLAERRGAVAVDVDLAKYLPLEHDRHHDLRKRAVKRRQVTHVFAHVVHHHRLTRLDCRAAEPLRRRKTL